MRAQMDWLALSIKSTVLAHTDFACTQQVQSHASTHGNWIGQHVFEVEARTERTALTAQDDRGDIAVLLKFLCGPYDAAEHLHVERIQFVRAIQGDLHKGHTDEMTREEIARGDRDAFSESDSTAISR